MRLLNVILCLIAPSYVFAQLGNLEGSLLGVNPTFDYVVVGGGTAGITLAYRLAQNPALSVALIEAGGYYELNNIIFSSTPGADVIGCGSDPSDTNAVDWNFVTTPQSGAAGRTIHYARGKCLGGSSARNFMIYQRGTVDSYQLWADTVNDQSYSWRNFLPYLQKSVTFTPPNVVKRAANASASFDPTAFPPSGGPLQVSYANYAQSFSSWMAQGLAAIGIGPRRDFNSGSLFGSQYCASTIDPKNQYRASSEQTFLQAAIRSGQFNLKIFTNTLAKKIMFDGNKKATGVVVTSLGLTSYILARKEVIVSAGAFQSPQLLMVSGIGPSATLKRYGIPVLKDNPNVGQNMWDHVFAGPTYRVNVVTLTTLANNLGTVLYEYLAQYSTNQAGVLTNPVCDYLGWEKTPSNLKDKFSSAVKAALSYFPADWPELEYLSGAGYIGNFANLFATQPKDGYQYATIQGAIVAPTSRGYITISSSDTSDPPIINPNWLTTPSDQALAAVAFKRARQAFAKMGSVVIGEEYYPGLNVSTDAQILKYYQENLMTVWHAACTCAMGAATDPKAVIDPQAKVIGVSGLRVVDASSFPILPPGHPQSTIYGLAEKIAASILNGQ